MRSWVKSFGAAVGGRKEGLEADLFGCFNQVFGHGGIFLGVFRVFLFVCLCVCYKLQGIQ